MGKCRDCQYSYSTEFTASADKPSVNICICTLTNYIVIPDVENDCNCSNKDLSEYDICYNCKYYRGGSDWGLFCSHKDMYHHLGKFSDKACERFERKADGNG